LNLLLTGRDFAAHAAGARAAMLRDTSRCGKKGKITIMPASGEVGFGRDSRKKRRR
jgi:hypothetical protein